MWVSAKFKWARTWVVQALDSQEEKAVESRWVFNHTLPAWPLAISLSYLCPEGWPQMISKVPSSLQFCEQIDRSQTGQQLSMKSVST